MFLPIRQLQRVARHYPALLMILPVGVLALILRLMFVSEVLLQHSAQEIQSFNPDSLQYLHLAHNLIYTGSYVLPTSMSRNIALLRTPGYPAFCAVFEWIGSSPSGILLAQAILGTSIPIATTLLVNAFMQSRLTGFIAGIASALSPTGVAITGIILADLLLSVAFIIGVALLYYGIVMARPWLCYIAGSAFGIAVLIKPVLSLWPIASTILYLLLARSIRSPIQLKHLFIFILLQLVFLAAWSTRNYMIENTFTLSAIGPQNLRYYVVPRVEEWVRAGHKPSDVDVMHNRVIPWGRDDEELLANKVRPTDIVRRQYVESVAVFKRYPLTTLRVYYHNVLEGLTSSWQHFDVQHPQGSILGVFLKRLSRMTEIFQNMWFILTVITLLDPFLGCRLRNSDWPRRYFSTLGLLVIITYFAAFAGTTYWTGSRVLYPCEFAFIALPLAGIISLVRGRCVA